MKYIFLSFLFCFSLFAQAQESSLNALAKKEATAKVSSFLELIPKGREKDYGFESRADFDKVIIEEPYEVYYVTYQNNQMGLLAAGEWRVPLSVNGKFVSLLTVRLNDGNMEAVDFGGNLLAEKIQSFETVKSSANRDHVLIRNTFLQRDYLTEGFSTLGLVYKENVSAVFNENATVLFYAIGHETAQPLTAKGLTDSTLFRINNPMSK